MREAWRASVMCEKLSLMGQSRFRGGSADGFSCDIEKLVASDMRCSEIENFCATCTCTRETWQAIFAFKQLAFNSDWTADMYYQVFILLCIVFERTDMDVHIWHKTPGRPESEFQDMFRNEEWFRLWVKFSDVSPRFIRRKSGQFYPEGIEYLEFTKRRSRQVGDENMRDVTLGAYRKMMENVLSHTFGIPCRLRHYGRYKKEALAELEQQIQQKTLQIIDLPKFHSGDEEDDE